VLKPAAELRVVDVDVPEEVGAITGRHAKHATRAEGGWLSDARAALRGACCVASGSALELDALMPATPQGPQRLRIR
jgi:hypothetical protein